MKIDCEVNPKEAWSNQLRPRRDSSVKEPSRLLWNFVLAHQIEQALAENFRINRAEIARQLNVSRARITQLMNMLRLPLQIQEGLLANNT